MGAYELGTAVNWTGTTSTDWSTATNWSSGLVPTPGLNISIGSASNQPHVTYEPASPAVCNNLTIQAGGVLSIDAGKALTINGILTNNAGNGGLVIQSDVANTGSLLHTTAGVNATVQRYLNDADWEDWKDGWHFLSSPVAAQPVNPSFTNNPSTEYDFYCWDEPSNLWVNYKNMSSGGGTAPFFDDINGSANFTPGKGYLAEYNTGDTKLFTGALNV
jgi:hypothetical protein